jgi:hypothetical protein
MNQWVVYSMIFYIFYIFGLLIYNLKRRLSALKAGKVRSSDFKTYSSENFPDELIVASRHIDNQFQVPMLFLITGVLYLSLDLVGILTVICMWGFVFSRLMHSYIHLGSNQVYRRAQAYTLGWFFVLLLWVQLAFVISN